MSNPFDFDKALKALQSCQALTGKDGIFALLIKQLTETALSAELDSHLALAKRPLKPRLAASNWRLRAIVMALFNPSW